MAQFSKDDYKSIFWTVLLILFIRGFIVEPFKIPSGSMIPTLLIGDHLFVAKGSYDIGIPFTTIKLIHVSDPKRGDVVVFRYPNPEKSEEKDGQFYIKRVIGIPGDRIEVKGGVPYVNGAAVVQVPLEQPPTQKEIPNFDFDLSSQLFRESLPDKAGTHWVQRSPNQLARLPRVISELQAETHESCIGVGKSAIGEVPMFNPLLFNEICPFTVPEGQYFMMGDNRDNSADGRDWGFVERRLLKGRALFIWLSLLQSDSAEVEGGPLLRWSRIGLEIH